MGSSASKTSRKLAKVAVSGSTSFVKRTNVDQLRSQQIPMPSHPPKAPLTSEEAQLLGSKAMKLGVAEIEEKTISLDQNNSAIRVLHSRQQQEKLGEDNKHKVDNRQLLDPRTITAILADLENGSTPEKVNTTYRLHPEFLSQLSPGIVRLARMRDPKHKQRVNDYEFDSGRRGRRSEKEKRKNDLQEGLDRLLGGG